MSDMRRIITLEGMGAFFHSVCRIVIKDEKIYCECINDMPECDMSQLGHGMGAYCPLSSFVYNLYSEEWRNHLKSVGMAYLIDIIEQN